MKRQLSQTGLAGIELLLIMATILAVAGIGVYLYSQRPPKTTTTNTPASDTTAPSGTSTSPNGIPDGVATPPPASSPANQNSIQITAVKMKIAVPDSLKDLTYHTRTMADNTTLVSFSSKALTAAIPACAADRNSGAFSTVTRGSGTYPGPANPSSGGLIKQYSGYYFAYTLPSSPCATGLSVEQQNLLNTLTQDFYGSLSSIQAL